jgi:hypothetical protein
MRCSWLLLIPLLLFGCGTREAARNATASGDAGGWDEAEVWDNDDSMTEAVSNRVDPASATGSGDGQPLPDADALQRKIIYTADVELVVEQFDAVPSKVEALARRFGGYVASSTIRGSEGQPRNGRWTIRVPVARYEESLAAMKQLGEVRRVSTDSRDVSEEYYDLEARIRNKKTQESRLLELLADATGKLEEVLKVERELSRVREEIERMEGRIRVLDDLTALTTVELSVVEIKDYVPEEAATYATRVRRAFGGSIDTMVSTAEGLSIWVVAASPWLGMLLVLVVALAAMIRIRRGRRS